MPELPEVEVVRRGLVAGLLGARLGEVEVLHPRPVRRQPGGATELAARLGGTRVLDVVRRGKFVWLELDSDEALLMHLGMSGQVVLRPPDAPAERHLRVRVGLDVASGHELRFVDQRMFGGLSVEDLVPTPDGGPGGTGAADEPGEATSRARLPSPVRHIARDVMDPAVSADGLTARLRARHTGLKRALLDQRLVSGVGNIYADEALWTARLHYGRATAHLTRPEVGRLLAALRVVMRQALAEGGTSFDALYVNVNGQSGYFSRCLQVYGQAGRPCPRCGASVRREAFMNRSSFLCPRCQPQPRHPHR